MPRKKRLAVATVNITTEPPHSPTRYRDIFIYLRDIGRPLSGKISRRENLMLAYCSIEDQMVSGSFAAYTYIDPTSPWWDTANRQAILDANGQPIPQVREGLGPNLRRISFILFVQEHRLAFDTREISPKAFEKGLLSLLEDPSVVEKFGPISVTVEPSHDIFQKIIDLPNKKRIEISLSLPNSDASSQMEKDIMDRYKRAGISRTEQVYSAQRGRSIDQDTEMVATMNIGRSNGYVKVIGVGEDGRNVPLSTKDYPRVLTEHYAETDYWKTFAKLSKKLVDSVRRIGSE